MNFLNYEKLLKKFSETRKCTCNELVQFETIDEIECDWGIHVVIQCPKCEELFSIDTECPAFRSMLDLENTNMGLFSGKEKFDYKKNSHPL